MNQFDLKHSEQGLSSCEHPITVNHGNSEKIYLKVIVITLHQEKRKL